MKSFSSSAINKSGKKFAPKAPVRRAPAGSSAAPPRKPSVAAQQQIAFQANQAVPETPAVEPENVNSTPAAPPASATPAGTPAAVSTSQNTEPKPSQPATAIPIPAPKRKPSVSTPIPVPVKPTAEPSEPAPPPQALPPDEPTPIESIENVPDNRRKRSIVAESSHVKESHDNSNITPTHPVRPAEPTTEVRPTKRLKASADKRVEDAQPGPSSLITPPAMQTSVVESATDIPEENELRATSQTVTDKGGKATKTRAKRSTRSGSVEIKRERRPRQRKPREPTPEGSENVEIAPTVMKMSDLCKDLRTGKMSKRETELRNMELAEQERREKAQQEGESTPAQQTPVKQNGDAGSPAKDQDRLNDQKQAGPVMRIVNGEIVLDTASLQVDRHAEARNVEELEDVVENSLTRKINQSTYGKRSKTESWDEELTDLFYRGLRMFGTDFMVISKMFPGRSRRQIKLKFNNEERKDPQRIKETLLGPRETIDIATYSEMTNTVYDDPRAIQKELDEEKKQIEDQHAKEKEAQEELLRNPDGGKDEAPAGGDKGNAPATKGKARNSKKSAKQMNTGTEEVVGSIDDFP